MQALPNFPWHTILDWYAQNGRHNLPWRAYFHLSEKDLGYRVWLSEILLQQTQVSRGVAYYEKILTRYPSIESLSESSYEEFFEYYQGLGYYSRARNMLKTAKIVSEEYDWIFPKDIIKLQGLPWVWPYTASAILSFAYNRPILSFDTNLQKIFARYYHGSRFAKLEKWEIEQIRWDFLESGISGRTMNAALMDFASSVSLNSKALLDWDSYPLEDCLFHQSHGVCEEEKEKNRVIFPTKDARIVVILHKDHKIYYSSKSDCYAPFLLPATELDIRHTVQTYFREHFALELSVRPIHAKYYENNSPFVACHAQIQTGKPEFLGYEKKELPEAKS